MPGLRYAGHGGRIVTEGKQTGKRQLKKFD